jgi:hypothetical protein
MKKYFKSITIGALGSVAWLLVGAGSLQAQDRSPQGNFDPAQMRQRMQERMKQQFEVTDDSEWKAISERIEKVMQARRSLGGPGGPGGFGGPGFRGGQGGAGGPGGPDTQGGPGGPPQQGGPGGPDSAQDRPRGQGGFGTTPGGSGGPGGFGRETSPELEALRTAIDNKAPASELKTKLADLRAARKKKEAELEKAQNDLREILSARQEAVAVMLGLLK